MLTPDHFVEDVGELSPALFPVTDAERLAGSTEESKLDGLLDAWIAEGYGRAAALAAGPVQDAAVEDWVYHRAKRAVYMRLNSAAARSESVEGVRVEFNQTQIDTWGTEAAAHRAAFDAALAPPPTPAPGRRRARRSVVVNANTAW